MLNTTPATNGNTTPNNGPITVRQAPNNGKITVSPTDTATIPTLDLANTQGTFESLLVAFDDVATIAGMLLAGKLPQYQQQALLRLLQSHAFEYALLCQTEHDSITEHLAGTRWGDDTGGKL